MARAKSGDQAAFRQLVERYGALTERTARVLLSDRSEAEDAVQEAWLDVWRGLARFELGRPFRPWLLTTVTNRCRMKARQREPVSVVFHDGLADVTPYRTEPEMDEEMDKELEEGLRELNDEQRQVLALRFYADLQLEEISELTGAPLGTVKSRLHRALQLLRTRMQKEGKVRDPRGFEHEQQYRTNG